MKECKRCGHTWETRGKEKPKACPACKSYQWNKKARSIIACLLLIMITVAFPSRAHASFIPDICNPCQTYIEGDGCVWVRDSKTIYDKQFCIEPVRCGGVICPDWIPDTPQKVNQLADAIFWAEGGFNTNYPFGIKSIKCEGYDECRRICKNTIRNNIGRYKNYLRRKNISTNRKISMEGKNYLNFLQNRYCPTSGNLTQSERNLNHHWLKNVRWFLNNPKNI